MEYRKLSKAGPEAYVPKVKRLIAGGNGGAALALAAVESFVYERKKAEIICCVTAGDKNYQTVEPATTLFLSRFADG